MRSDGLDAGGREFESRRPDHTFIFSVFLSQQGLSLDARATVLRAVGRLASY